MDTDFIDPKYAELVEMGVGYAVNVASALAVLIIGLAFASLLQRWIRKAMGRVDRIDDTLSMFVARGAKYAVQILVLITVLAQFGVETTSILAVLGAAGLAIGLALQGTLANIAAGFMILMLRPFNVGEFIEAGDVSGTIVEIGLFTTYLKTADGIYVSSPNSQLWSSVITNYSRNPTRRFELLVGIGYDDKIEKAMQTLMKIAEADDRVHSDPEPQVMVKSLDDSAVTIALRVWTSTEDFWQVNWDLTREVKESFDKAKISFPYPQRDIHVYQMSAS